MNNSELETYITLIFGPIDETFSCVENFPDELCMLIISRIYPAFISDVIDNNSPKEVLRNLAGYEMSSSGTTRNKLLESIHSQYKECAIEYVQSRQS